jgi:hypothetical protein
MCNGRIRVVNHGTELFGLLLLVFFEQILWVVSATMTMYLVHTSLVSVVIRTLESRDRQNREVEVSKLETALRSSPSPAPRSMHRMAPPGPPLRLFRSGRTPHPAVLGAFFYRVDTKASRFC